MQQPFVFRMSSGQSKNSWDALLCSDVTNVLFKEST